MAGKENRIQDSEIVNEVAVAQPGKMEFRLINPTEDGFLRVIRWNKEELEAAVRQKISAYENIVYTEDNLKQAKADRAELNKLTKAIEDRRKMVKRILNEPYNTFESELKEILALIQEPVGIIDRQVKAFEDKQKEEKKERIRETYDAVIGVLADVLSFEKVFDNRYLNQTYKLATAQSDVKAKVEKVRTDLETIDSLESKYKLNAKDVYIKTLDLSQALAENKRLMDLEERLEAEKRRKAEEEAERKRQEEERRKAAEERERLAEEQRKAQEAQRKPEQESAGKQPESVIERPENVIKGQKIGTESPQNVSNGTENGTVPLAYGAEPASEIGRTIQDIDRQAYASAAGVSLESHMEGKPVEKRYRTRFYAKGTRGQLEGLIRYMSENNIEYGRIDS